MTTDVTKAIAPRSDQLNADDLLTGPRTIRITGVDVKETTEQPINISFDGDDGRPWRPAKTAARCLASIWGPNAAQWVGMHCTIYNDPTVTWAGAAVGGIRVSHMEGLDKPRTLQLTKTRGKKGAVTIQPLVMDGSAETKIDQEAALQSAKEAAKKGKDAFTQWWKENADKREAIKPHMDELKKIVEEADKPEIDDDEVPL